MKNEFKPGDAVWYYPDANRVSFSESGSPPLAPPREGPRYRCLVAGNPEVTVCGSMVRLTGFPAEYHAGRERRSPSVRSLVSAIEPAPSEEDVSEMVERAERTSLASRGLMRVYQEYHIDEDWSRRWPSTDTVLKWAVKRMEHEARDLRTYLEARAAQAVAATEAEALPLSRKADDAWSYLGGEAQEVAVRVAHRMSLSPDDPQHLSAADFAKRVKDFYGK